MTLPNLPTDNLYKFIALSGLTLILSTLFLYSSKLIELRSEIDLTKSDLEMTSLDIDFLEKDSGIDRISQDSIKIDTTKLDKAERRRLIELGREIERKVKLIEIKTRNLSDKNLNFFILSFALLIVLGAGLFMTKYGFQQWYYKIQKPMDDRTFLELKNIKSETKKITSDKSKESSS